MVEERQQTWGELSVDGKGADKRGIQLFKRDFWVAAHLLEVKMDV